MNKRAWVIKLGSGGRCIAFCERHGIVGLGWKQVRGDILASASRDELYKHVTEVCGYPTNRKRASATGQLHRFARECSVGDYVLYYAPPRKQVVITRVTSDAQMREFDPSDDTDIWHIRKVEHVRTVPVLDVHGGLKGRILGPRMSFWELRPFDLVDEVARDNGPRDADPDLERAYDDLSRLVLRRAVALNEKDWEWLVVDYFKAQGAHVDERTVGGNRPIIDMEARFDHGELGEEVWRVQVKRYQDKPVDWPAIRRDMESVGDTQFCYVSVYGFTEDARTHAEEEDVRLLEAGDFTRFLLSGKLREDLRRKLLLPTFGAGSS